MTIKKARHLLKLYEQITRADIMSRLGPLACTADYASIKIVKENELREYLYGTSSLVELGNKFGLLKSKRKKKKWRKSNADNNM